MTVLSSHIIGIPIPSRCFLYWNGPAFFIMYISRKLFCESVIMHGPTISEYSHIQPHVYSMRIWLVKGCATVDDRHGVSNTQQSDYSFNGLFRLLTRKTIKPRITDLLWGESIDDRWITHRGPIMQKKFPCHDMVTNNMIDWEFGAIYMDGFMWH